jgi:DNA-binding Xre family transcriptional regulator
MTEFLGGPHTESLEKRVRAVLAARVGHWEAAALEKRSAIEPIHPHGSGDELMDDRTLGLETPKLDVQRIGKFIRDEGYDNKDLATALKISPRAVSSLRNGGKNHGVKALKKLANLMNCDVEDLYLS